MKAKYADDYCNDASYLFYFSTFGGGLALCFMV